MRIKAEHLIEKGKLGAYWLASRQTSRGNYKGLESGNANGIYPDTDDIGCYYKSVYSLRINGETKAAVKSFSYVMRRFMTPEGDFVNSPEVRSGGTYTSTYCQLYPNGWLLRAAMALRWFDVGRLLFDFIFSCRDSQTAGFRSRVGNQSPIVDSNSTAICVLGCVLAGRHELAIAGGDFLIRMIEAQPDPSKFYIRWMPGEGPITEYSEDKAKYYVIDASQPAQFYWQAGLPMCVLAQLYGFTGEDRFLGGAIKYHDFLVSCHSDVTCTPAAGKVSWGSSLLYRLTKDKRYLSTAQSVLEFLLDIQQKEGWMLLPQYSSFEEQPIKVTYDNTAEFSCWLADSAIELMES